MEFSDQSNRPKHVKSFKIESNAKAQTEEDKAIKNWPLFPPTLRFTTESLH